MLVVNLLTSVSTAFSGGSVDGILVNDGTNDLMGVVPNDPKYPGVYIVDLGAEAIVRGATVTVRPNRVMVQLQVHSQQVYV